MLNSVSAGFEAPVPDEVVERVVSDFTAHGGTVRSAPVAPDWCPDDGTRDNVVARRNVLAALWAGRLIELSGASLTAYAIEVHVADFKAAGDDDVVDKITADLRHAGRPTERSHVRAVMTACHREALRQTQVTD